jgi:cytochrome c oxidase cbb3-type subunit 3
MSDFTSDIWGVYVAVMTIASIVACAVLLKALSTRRAPKDAPVGTTGHTWDEDLAEWNNPMPRWWIWLFYLTIAFGLVYLALYPGLGGYAGWLGWSSTAQFDAERKGAQAQYGPIYAKFAAQDLKEVATDAEARAIGQRLFLNHCAQCHGSDAGGARGFPSLRDRDWLYGGDPEAIKASIADGRAGVMPALGAAVGGDDGAKDVAHYVLSLSGRTHDTLRAFSGKQKFRAVCAACHGPEGKGNPQLGAPNLTDAIWLHGSSETAIIETILKGRKSEMPAHKHFLDDAKIHLLAAYVYSLSRDP